MVTVAYNNCYSYIYIYNHTVIVVFVIYNCYSENSFYSNIYLYIYNYISSIMIIMVRVTVKAIVTIIKHRL